MADDRLYLVDTTTKEYLLIAKRYAGSNTVGNIDLYSEFISSRGDISELIVGSESDDEFFFKHIKRGANFNKANKWVTVK